MNRTFAFFALITILSVAPWSHAGASGMDVVQQGGSQWVNIYSPYSVNATDAAVLGSDGNVWTNAGGPEPGPAIGRVTPNGFFTAFTLPIRDPPEGLVAGPDGRVWFRAADPITFMPEVGRITTDGQFSFYPIAVFHMCVGPDKNVWSINNGIIERITPAGNLTTYPVHGQSFRGYCHAGLNGTVWFTSADAGTAIARIDTTSGKVSVFSNPQFHGPLGITLGADGNMWFVDDDLGSFSTSIGNITPAGVVTEYTAPGNFFATYILPASPTSFYFDVPGGIGTATTSGIFTFDKSDPALTNHNAAGLTFGSDGNVWLPEYDIMAVFVRRIMSVAPDHLVLAAPGSQGTLTVSETRFSGNWMAMSSNPRIATVAHGSGRTKFVVTGRSRGECTVTISDPFANSVLIDTIVR